MFKTISNIWNFVVWTNGNVSRCSYGTHTFEAHAMGCEFRKKHVFAVVATPPPTFSSLPEKLNHSFTLFIQNRKRPKLQLILFWTLQLKLLAIHFHMFGTQSLIRIYSFLHLWESWMWCSTHTHTPAFESVSFQFVRHMKLCRPIFGEYYDGANTLDAPKLKSMFHIGVYSCNIWVEIWWMFAINQLLHVLCLTLIAIFPRSVALAPIICIDLLVFACERARACVRVHYYPVAVGGQRCDTERMVRRRKLRKWNWLPIWYAKNSLLPWN